MTRRVDSDSPDSDWLDEALTADGREHRADYLSDEGFTALVMKALPAPEKLPVWRTPAVLILWTLAAIGIAVLRPELGAEIAREVLRVIAAYPISLSGIATGLVALGAATWAATA